MAKTVLFVCKSCVISTQSKDKNRVPDGTYLLDRLIDLHQNWSRRAELEIQAVGCLCICDRPCAVAIAGEAKPTFLFVDLPVEESAIAILKMSEFYLNSEDGYVPRFQLPPLLQSARLARIPPLF